MVIILGGGIGGLTLALCLHRIGVACRVFEAADEFKPLGVGINLLPHALRVLSRLDLTDALAQHGVEAREFAYFNSHGQLIFREPCGRHAGYRYPHFSIHRADLHKVLHDAVTQRLGDEAVVMGHRARQVEQDDRQVRAYFSDNADHRPVSPARGTIAIACDGFHSAIRHQFYPDEGPPHFGGINMWRGVTRRQPFLTGASVTRIGPVATGKLVVYPIRDFRDGTQLINWTTEQPRDDHKANDWATRGHVEDFIAPFDNWDFDWLDVPSLFRNAEFILEYPMVDRDPVDRWVFGRVALMGDAAHPMYPRGGNGGAQAILDAETIADELEKGTDAVGTLAAFQKQRLEQVNRIVLMNRRQPPDYIIETVEQRTGGQAFGRIEDVVSEAELSAISDRYKEVAGYDIDAANR